MLRIVLFLLFSSTVFSETTTNAPHMAEDANDDSSPMKLYMKPIPLKRQDVMITAPTLFPPLPTLPPPPSMVELPTLPTLPPLWQLLGLPPPTDPPSQYKRSNDGVFRMPLAAIQIAPTIFPPFPPLPTAPHFTTTTTKMPQGVTFPSFLGLSTTKPPVNFDGFIDIMNQVLHQVGMNKINETEAKRYANPFPGLPTIAPLPTPRPKPVEIQCQENGKDSNGATKMNCSERRDT